MTEIAYNSNLLVRTLGWDSQYQLEAVSNGTTEVESYTYDPFGRRLSDHAGTQRPSPISTMASIALPTWTPRARWSAATPTGLGSIIPLAMTVYGDETNTYYYLTDHLGSVLALTDEDGQLVESYEYDAFGRIQGL